MKKLELVMEHPLFKECMLIIDEAEKNRKFCRHGYEHGLDVARICYIINLEERLGYDKELIYAMAMLHDLGRSKEYEDGSSHHNEGAKIAKEILEAAGYEKQEIAMICDAVSKHRTHSGDNENKLAELLFRADKLSRCCFSCKAYDECYWADDLKKKYVTY